MATGAAVTLVAATAKLLRTNSDHDGPQEVWVINESATALLLGGQDISATVYGVSIAAGGSQRILLAPRDSLYGYSVAGGTIRVMSSP